MSGVGIFIFLLVIGVRVIAPLFWRYARFAGHIDHWWLLRGRVKGHRGPSIFSFKGRATRREWGITVAGCAFAAAIAAQAQVAGGILAAPWILAIVAVSARRFHDLDRPGWYALAPVAAVISNMAFLSTVAGPDYQPASVASPLSRDGAILAASLFLMSVFFVPVGVMAFVRGKDAPNVFGEAEEPN